MSEADLYASVATPPRASWVSELPLAIRAPLYTFAFLFTVKVVSRILRYRCVLVVFGTLELKVLVGPKLCSYCNPQLSKPCLMSKAQEF